ncbi:MAG TPA: hypothetical protein VE974_28585 [Thermoanaerobaculia bacterium]|nr:hypothetical protein [Thermoanaerobaculia bacterium]
MAQHFAHALGELDPFDLIIRIDEQMYSSVERIYTVLAHELTHYVQVAATPAGLLQYAAVNDLHYRVFRVLRERGFPDSAVDLADLLPREGESASDARPNTPGEILLHLADLWRFADWPVLRESVHIHAPQARVTWDVATATVRVGELYSCTMGLHAIFEVMAQAIEYHNRFLLAKDQLGVGRRWGEDIDKLLQQSFRPGDGTNELFHAPGLLYEWPLMHAIQCGISPMNVVAIYVILCGWITLYDAQLYTTGSLAFGRRFLELMNLFESVGPDLYRREMLALKSGRPAFNPISMSDELCASAGITPFSALIEQFCELLQNVIPFGPPIAWVAVDGYEIVRRCREAPATFLLLPPQSSRFGRLPRPVIKWRDSWEVPTNGGDHRVYNQLGWAVQKEILFGACDNYRALSTGNYGPCRYGQACIFRGSGKWRTYLRQVIDLAYASPLSDTDS